MHFTFVQDDTMFVHFVTLGSFGHALRVPSHVQDYFIQLTSLQLFSSVSEVSFNKRLPLLEQNNDDFAEKWPSFLFGVPTFTYLILLIILSICVFFYQIYSFGLLAMSHFTFSCEYLFQVINSKCKFYTCREVLKYWHKSKV